MGEQPWVMQIPKRDKDSTFPVTRHHISSGVELKLRRNALQGGKLTCRISLQVGSQLADVGRELRALRVTG